MNDESFGNDEFHLPKLLDNSSFYFFLCYKSLANR